MAQDSWNNASVILSVITAVAGATYTAAHFVKIAPATDALAKAHQEVKEANDVIQGLHKQLAACTTEQGKSLRLPTNDAAASELTKPQDCDAVVGHLKSQLQGSETTVKHLRDQMEQCWARFKTVTPKNFSLRKGNRQTVLFKDSELGFTFVDWVNRDTKDATISVDATGTAPAVILLRESNGADFNLGQKRFTAAIEKAERVNDRIWIRVDEVD